MLFEKDGNDETGEGGNLYEQPISKLIWNTHWYYKTHFDHSYSCRWIKKLRMERWWWRSWFWVVFNFIFWIFFKVCLNFMMKVWS